MAAKTYRLRLTHEGREFEAEGDKAFVLDMLKKFGPAGSTAFAPSPVFPESKGKGKKEEAAPALRGKAVSIREFVQQLGFKKHTDITLAFGYYLERFGATPAFTPADINNCYYEAKIDSSNTSQMIILNIRRGFIMPAKKLTEGKKRYTLTQSGERFVEGKLKGSA